jgi:hypothetical protein
MGLTTDTVMNLTARTLGLKIKPGKNNNWYILYNSKDISDIITVYIEEETGKIHCSKRQEDIDKCFSESAKNLLRCYYAEIV